MQRYESAGNLHHSHLINSNRKDSQDNKTPFISGPFNGIKNGSQSPQCCATKINDSQETGLQV